jgi:CRP/FNR family nitrogen fixation transcriptional regulator
MSHQDIADYLGLSIETVSRTITGLEQRGSIARGSSRRILILKDHASLARMLS